MITRLRSWRRDLRVSGWSIRGANRTRSRCRASCGEALDEMAEVGGFEAAAEEGLSEGMVATVRGLRRQ